MRVLKPSRTFHYLAGFLVVLLAACGTNEGETGATTSATPEPAVSVAPVTLAQSAVAATPEQSAVAVGEFTNPVIARDFPDPDALKVGNTYYVYATNAAGSNVQVAKSTDLVNWEMLPDALPKLPGWSRTGLTWAPEVTSTAAGTGYVMYFTARDTKSDRQCIGTATSAKPEGPFTSDTTEAFICQSEDGGSIDAGSFVDDDGTRYLLWKNDGNCCGKRTWIYIQRVSADGLTLEGEPAQLIRNDKAWEGALVEAPTLWKHEGKYYLFYSANSYANQTYAVGYAVADTVLGPYAKPTTGALLKTDMRTYAAFGPGGQDIVLDKDGETWMLYHSWDTSIEYRWMQIDELAWENGLPVVKGPDRKPQPAP